MKAVFLDFATMGADGLDLTPLRQQLPELEVFDTTAPAATAERIRDAEFVLANKVVLNADNMSEAGALRFIGLTATGSDNVDLAFASELDIAVCNIRSYCTQSVVEHVIGSILNLTHSIGFFRGAVADGEWQKSNDFCMLNYPLRELSAMTLGIVGYGALGQGVAQAAEFFGMDVLITRRRDASAVHDDGRIDFDDMIRRADIVSLHCPLNDSTRNLMGAAEFRAMKPDSILINTARGGLVDSAALADALAQGEIAAAAIDVLPQEPPVSGNPLLDYQGENLVVTPHIAWATVQARQNAINQLAENIASFKDGQRRNRIA
jgi:glycerate dehydrogenase